MTRVYLAGPVNMALKIAFVLLLATAVRAIAHRAINRITARAADGPAGARAGPGRGLLPERSGERRRQRSHALGLDPEQRHHDLIFGIAGSPSSVTWA